MKDDRNTLLCDIKKNHKLSLISLFGILGVIIFGGFFILLLFAKQWILMIIFSILLLFSVLLLIFRQKNINHTKRELPYTINGQHNIMYDDILKRLQTLTFEDDRLEISSELSMFKIKEKFSYRILVSKIDNFNKKEYDSLKNRANKKFNTKYQPKQWVERGAAHRMMRINIISADKINDKLNGYISRNVAQMLRRVEGAICFVVCDNKLFIPPLYGDIDSAEVDRYKKSIKFILDLLNISLD